MDHDPLFDYYSPGFLADPYPFYARLRAVDPVHWGLPYEPYYDGAWHITRYADVAALLKDPRLGKAELADERGREAIAELPPEAHAYLGLLRLAMLRTDPPDHTRLRGLVSRAFTPRMVEALRPRVEAIATELLDTAEAKGGADGELDLIDQYAFPLSITVITEMLGLDYDDRAQLKRWAGVLVSALECKRTTERYAPASAISAEVFEFFHQQIALRRREPRPGILSDLLAVRDQDGDRLTEPELIVTCTLLLVAGHDTTVNLIGNGMLALLRRPEQLALLRDRPELTPAAVEEFLRYDSSTQMAARVAQEDVELDGKVIQRGQAVNLLLGSANHDPAQFANPDQLDVTRTDNKHIAFGQGIHYCIGAPLARLEAQTAVSLLLRRRPHLELAVAEPPRRPTVSFRGLERLPVVG
ncbi:MAG TPA: cytochrome P450 [Ktedonobacterales bacterium]